MANRFWLKSALDLILAVLKDDEKIMLAPNSAQAPPIMPGTRNNIFSPNMQSQMQQQQQQQAAAAAVAAAAAQQQQQAAAAAGAGGGQAQPEQQQAQPKQESGADGAAAVVKQEEGAGAAAAVKQEDQQQEAGPSAMEVDAAAAPVPAAAAAAGGGEAAAPAAPAAPQPPAPVPAPAAAAAAPPPPAAAGDAAGDAAAAAAAAFPVTVRECDVPDSIRPLLLAHLDFLHTTGELSVRDMMGPLREYAQVWGVWVASGWAATRLTPVVPASYTPHHPHHSSRTHSRQPTNQPHPTHPPQVDAYVAYHLWVLVFPIVWATLAKQQQINLAKPIISMLSKEYHQRQALLRPNVVQVSRVVGGPLGRRGGGCPDEITGLLRRGPD
jgi:transformation/transcription domain-associated protein